MFKYLRKINQNNEFHGRLILTIILFEKLSYVKFPFKFLRRIIVQMFYNCEISPESFDNIESLVSLRIPHPFMVIIHKTAKIGANCTIFQGVTIGVVEKVGANQQAAIIGADVYIGCKASILGSLYISKGAKIGAHALVLSNVEAGKTIVGIYK